MDGGKADGENEDWGARQASGARNGLPSRLFWVAGDERSKPELTSAK